MSDEKKGGIEEICLGHLSLSINETLKERLTLSYSLRKETNETLQEFLGRMMPKENVYARLSKADYLILMQMGSLSGIPLCGYCLCDEDNKKCPSYHNIHLHTYSVLPKEEPEKKAE